MKLGTPGFVGGRLREAREVRDFTAVALAEIVGVSTQAISQYETGKSSPSPDVLSAVAAALNLPQSFFTEPARDYDRGAVFYRSMSSATKRARARAERRLAWLRDMVRYTSRYVEFPAVNFPDLDLPSNPLLLSDDEIEDAAGAVRRYWNMGDGPIGNMVALLENHGAIVARDQLGAETLDGVSEWAPDEGRPYVMIGTDKGTAARWRFDAAHELGHIVLHARVTDQFLSRPEHFKRIEEQAHRFGAAFLLPMESFEEDFFAASLDTMRTMKAKWNVSIAMMIMRGRHAGLLSEQTERRLWVNYSRRGWRTFEPMDDFMEVERPALLRQSFELILSERRQTPRDVLASLRLNAADVEALSGLERGYLNEAFAAVALRPRDSGDDSEAATSGEVIPLPVRPRRRV